MSGRCFNLMLEILLADRVIVSSDKPSFTHVSISCLRFFSLIEGLFLQLND